MKRLLTSDIIEAAKELARGVFWITDDGLLAFPHYEDSYIGVAKSGLTNNHKSVWKELQGTKGKPYNYYPRGRVDLDNKGRAKIFVNPNIGMDKWLPKIKTEFGIVGDNYSIFVDGSDHYRCYLDDGWKPDRS